MSLSPIHPRYNAEGGFTLVELAIAIIVIGVLIGGVLKGQELYENARIVNTVQMLKTLQTNARTFKDTYGALPGDLRNPGSRLPNCTGQCAVMGNTADIDDSRIAHANEVINFWIHLERTGLLWTSDIVETGAFANENGPFNPFKTRMGIWNTAGMPDGAASTTPQPMNWIKIAANPQRSTFDSVRSHQIDLKMDDGMPTTGNVRLSIWNAGATANQCHDHTTLEYNTRRDTAHSGSVINKCMPSLRLEDF